MEVNVVRPEENGPCKVFVFRDKNHGRYVYDGYKITMEVDLRVIMQDHYAAQLLGPHEVLVQVPAYSYTWLQDVQEYNQDQKCPIMKQCHTVRQISM